jgi:hypothetical protein
MSIEKPVKDWAVTLDTLDIQQKSDRSFGAIVGLTVKLVLPSFISDYILPKATE